MKIFLDTANIDEIKKYIDWGICDGVTTNPTINLSCGVQSTEEMYERSTQIASLIAPFPFSVEVTTDEPDEMLKQAREYSTWASNIVIKIPITTRSGESCLPVIHKLYLEGITVNTTAMMTLNQAMLAAKAGSKFISLFGGRIDDEGGDATTTIHNLREWLDRWTSDLPNHPEIIIGSSRTTKNISDWAMTGAHILTVTPGILAKILLNARTKETVSQFIEDSEKALAKMTAWPVAQVNQSSIDK
jgi:transaldolase